MNLIELLGQYIEIMNCYNGHDSAEAKKFAEDHKDSVRFVRLVKTASFFWKTRH